MVNVLQRKRTVSNTVFKVELFIKLTSKKAGSFDPAFLIFGQYKNPISHV